MATQQIALHDDGQRTLPPVLIDAHSLFVFSMRLHHSLGALEKRFAAAEKPGVPTLRQKWTPLPNKPR
ncbi:MAG: hypothetical protein AAGA92_06840 [Planctomycetota bacterium]